MLRVIHVCNFQMSPLDGADIVSLFSAISSKGLVMQKYIFKTQGTTFDKKKQTRFYFARGNILIFMA